MSRLAGQIRVRANREKIRKERRIALDLDLAQVQQTAAETVERATKKRKEKMVVKEPKVKRKRARRIRIPLEMIADLTGGPPALAR